VFGPVNCSQDLSSSFQRQADLIANLTPSSPPQLPPAHQLTKVGGPVNPGAGACGAHYIFQVDHLDGTALNASEASNMVNALGFYGYAVGGTANPFIAFTASGRGCPTGRTCVAVDPTDSGDGSTATTTGQAAVSYPMNRLWDPANATLGSACVTTANKAATMVSKCSTLPLSHPVRTPSHPACLRFEPFTFVG
jgi:hypothetical protein